MKFRWKEKSKFLTVQVTLSLTTARPFVLEISSFECKRILFHSITDIDATTGCTVNPRVVLKSGENFLPGSLMFFRKSTVSLLILGEMLRFEENSSAKCTPNNPANFQIDRSNGSCEPIDKNLETVKGTRFSYLISA
ncbi:hypothetical protein PV328_010431 [Microctonus aethiopoides]|uniref:Uncharacterized protein n=1 Tax=Microctonus aethiopoides TaxID=144406 RepID=A0AA39FHY4_9HYME|nr:hypothetical protein PV328_010431 [Microctonus aethiopoides]